VLTQAERRPPHPSRTESSLLSRVTGFLSSIGIVVRLEPIDHATILPGLTVDHGELVVDQARLRHVGDVLHEAAHIAVTPADERPGLNVNVGDDGGSEMAALAWSYAAARHLDIDPRIVFHDGGYRGGAQSLIDNFDNGRYVGVPILAWRGMTTDRDFPIMSRWLAD
jgi:hypothetical protein